MPLDITQPYLQEHETIHMKETLSQQQQVIIPIAAFAAVGDMTELKLALNQGLEHGLSINEIKEVLIQTYAYAGFPRSLNALNELMNVLDQRQKNGIHDHIGRASQPLAKDYQPLIQGTLNQTQVVGQPVKGALFEFAPTIDEYLKTHLFGDIFSRDILSWQDREIATVSMLSALDGVENQLKSHVQISLNVGISTQQLQEIQHILEQTISIESSQRLARNLSP